MKQKLRAHWISLRRRFSSLLVAFLEAIEYLLKSSKKGSFGYKLKSMVKRMGEPSKLELLEERLERLELKSNRLIEVADGALGLVEDLSYRTRSVTSGDFTRRSLSDNEIKGRVELLKRELHKCRGSGT